MTHLPPNHRLYSSFRPSVGPGAHADELDMSLDVLAQHLSAPALRALAEEVDPAEVRANPPAGADDPDAMILPFDDLLPLLKLVTGQWGPDPTGTYRQLVRRPNPADGPLPPHVGAGRDWRSFFDRQQDLRDRLVHLADIEIPERYRRRDAAVLVRLRTRLAAASGARRAELERALADVGEKDRMWPMALRRMIAGLDHVLSQRGRPDASILSAPIEKGGLPLGLRWSILAAKGNQKLPFVSYSELPMVTCPGAGMCRVPMDPGARAALRKKGGGWCYSFKSFRSPEAVANWFLNTLANYADREFAILRGGGPEVPDSEDGPGLDRFERARFRAAIAGRGHAVHSPMLGRVWMQFVKNVALALTREERGGMAARGRREAMPPRVCFVRLFVDGDVNTADNVMEWMEACRDSGPGGVDVASGEEHLEYYGYSKCWRAFLDVNEEYHRVGVDWPSNYTLNLSSGSIYAGGAARGQETPRAAEVRTRIEGLPITRGYFEAVPLRAYMEKLEQAVTIKRLRLPVVGQMSFSFSRARQRDFVALNRVRSLTDLAALRRDWPASEDAPMRLVVPTAEARAAALREVAAAGALLPRVTVRRSSKPHLPTLESQVRAHAYRAYFSRLLAGDRDFAAMVREELARDEGYADEAAYLAARQRASLARADRDLAGGRTEADRDFTDKALHDKALALALGEVLWAYGLGGSCPLICGNCFDQADRGPGSVHRCASKTTFRDKTIHIGLH